MKMTIYIPDDLAAEVKSELGDQNISAICQAALRAELRQANSRKAAAEKLGEAEFERIEAFDAHGDDQHDVAFQGKQIGCDIRGNVAYLTPKANIAVVGDGDVSSEELLGVYRSYDTFVERGVYSWELLSEVAGSLGEEAPVEELDI